MLTSPHVSALVGLQTRDPSHCCWKIFLGHWQLDHPPRPFLSSGSTRSLLWSDLPRFRPQSGGGCGGGPPAAARGPGRPTQGAGPASCCWGGGMSSKVGRPPPSPSPTRFRRHPPPGAAVCGASGPWRHPGGGAPRDAAARPPGPRGSRSPFVCSSPPVATPPNNSLPGTLIGQIGPLILSPDY